MPKPTTLLLVSEIMPLHKVFIGIGSNIGDRLRYLQEAVNRLVFLDKTSVSSVSPVYMTEPVGETSQNRFYNSVVLLETALLPEELRQHCKNIEQGLGRSEEYPRWSPRVIDLDILLYDNQIISTEALSIPHPQLQYRKFVLVPLLDIANPVYPITGQSIKQLLESCHDRSVLIKLREGIEDQQSAL